MTMRGFVPTDEIDFSEQSMMILRKAQKDILYLIEQGYPMKSASTFVGNHYMLSERQRLAIVRATAPINIVEMRRKKLEEEVSGKKISIDGLNLIITLEVALSETSLICCMDGTIRDLAGLRGTYRLIDKTDDAIRLIGEKLMDLRIEEAVFYLDAPVSNTGRLKQRIYDILGDYPYRVAVELVNNADVCLENMEHVITSDAIILNKCLGWINLAALITKEKIPQANCINLSGNYF
jgi:hypothetical protein